MARGAIKSIDDQMKELDMKIVSYQSKIAALNSKKKALLSSKEKAEMDALYQAVKDSGKSPSELISQLAK